jgi:hypothetical protein
MLLGVGLLVWSCESRAAEAADALRAIRSYAAGQSRAGLDAVRALVGAAATEAARSGLAAALASELRSDATVEAKRFLCAQLALVAGEAEVPALAACLADKDLALAARAALEHIPGEAASAALRTALAGARGMELAGLINSLGNRRDGGAVRVIAPFAGDARIEVVESALGALGNIGTAEAAAALAAVEKTLRPRFMPLRAEALLACAERLAAEGGAPRAEAIRIELAAAEDLPEHLRTGALLALLGTESAAAAAAVKAAAARGDAAVFSALLRAVALREGAGAEAFARRAAALLAAAEGTRFKAQAALLLFRLEAPPNLALGATASSPDGLDRDGGAGGDQAAIDGDLDTYWDEVDDQPLYRLVVTFKKPEAVSLVRIVGHAHHDYAPKDFEILCDGKAAAAVVNARYTANEFLAPFPETTATTLELRITGCYGRSPAIRELGIYRWGAGGALGGLNEVDQ